MREMWEHTGEAPADDRGEARDDGDRREPTGLGLKRPGSERSARSRSRGAGFLLLRLKGSRVGRYRFGRWNPPSDLFDRRD